MKTIVIETQEQLDALPCEFLETTDIQIRSNAIVDVRVCYKNANVYACDSSRVRVYGSLVVHACNLSLVNAYDSSEIYAYDASTINTCDTSTAHVSDSSTANAFDTSTVTAHGSSTIYAYDSSTINAHDSSTVTACSTSTVNAYDLSRVDAQGSSIVNSYSSFEVKARDSSTIYAYGSSIVYAHGLSMVYAIDSSTVYAYDLSTINAYLCSFLIVHSVSVKIKSLLDNSRLVYKIQNGQRPEKQDPTATIIEFKEIITPTFDEWLRRGFVVADGIYQRLMSQKAIGSVNIYETDQGFVARIGDKFSHGKTIEEAKNDLRYKLSDRDTSKYKSLNLDDVKSTDELIESYMAITGACSFGVRQFCESIQLKDSYTVEEIIELTKGKYGNEQYSEFFLNDQLINTKTVFCIK